MSQKMTLEWKEIKEALPHSGEKGSALEDVFKIFLKKYLPKNLEISDGFIIDSSGNESKQLDVIIHDAFKTPVMFNKNDIKVIPVECVYAVIEVKADITSITSVCDIFENMKSVKNLEKKSYVHPTGDLKFTVIEYGKEWDIWPINYFVFAIDSMDLVIISNSLNKKNQEENRDVSKRIDCICVLNEGVMMNQLSNGKFSSMPEPGSICTVLKTTKPLLFFYRLISNHLFQASMPSFQFTEYTKNVRY